VDTEIDRHLNAVMQFGLKMLAALSGKSIAQGAATSCYVATSPSLATTSGAYFEDCNAVTVLGHNHLYDVPMSERLLQVSEEITADFLVDQKTPTKENLLDDRAT
jgi:WW domain-containing oxidoreductase